ncbi:recombinase family protein [Rossellomorea marisflavi]|uniref:recombinase family protein n=1 Tax=Rossellomorea marisflavi TaxID=189381 RepID=UPI003D2EA0D4
MAKQFGYARVSTAEQSLEAQIQTLQEAGVAEIYKDKATGKNTNRAGLQAVKMNESAGGQHVNQITLCLPSTEYHRNGAIL